MRSRVGWTITVGALAWASLLAWPPPARAQTVSGQAEAVQATIGGLVGMTTTALSSTGSLSGPNDARDASQLTGNLPSLLTGDVLHATTIGWPDQVDSEASLADLALTIAGSTIGADFVMSQASAVLGFEGAGAAVIDGLSINGVPIWVTGEPNQIISIPGGQLVIDQVQTSPASTVVNALHVIVYGVADIVVASATAGVN